MEDDRLAHALELSEELLTDLELERLSVGSIVLKASRLARIMEDDAALTWLSLELSGYQATTPGTEDLITATGRWHDREKGTWWPYPAAQLDTIIAAAEVQLATLALPSLSGDMVLLVARATLQSQAQVKSEISQFAGIRARIVATLHEFASRHYYALRFSGYQAQLFDDARLRVDQLLAPLTSGALEKVDSIYRRLAEGDAEAISQGLTTCRRLIDSVADEVFPPTDETHVLNGNEVLLTKQHTQNRINAFVHLHTDSQTRRAKLRRTLSDLYGRVSTGVHDDVTSEEARYLFLNTYMFLGEVLALPLDGGLPASGVRQGGEPPESPETTSD